MAHVLPGLMQKHSSTIRRGPVEEKEGEREEGRTFRMVTYFLQHRLSLNRAYVDVIVKYLMATYFFSVCRSRRQICLHAKRS